ncbi:hypothetical protein EDB83DRAFT_2316240 [Lactarius deliciosus]|nr:hypothetical protein EDB83DRAFT_2316240 [Lactarius deliciosus]
MFRNQDNGQDNTSGVGRGSVGGKEVDSLWGLDDHVTDEGQTGTASDHKVNNLKMYQKMSLTWHTSAVKLGSTCHLEMADAKAWVEDCSRGWVDELLHGFHYCAPEGMCPM